MLVRGAGSGGYPSASHLLCGLETQPPKKPFITFSPPPLSWRVTTTSKSSAIPSRPFPLPLKMAAASVAPPPLNETILLQCRAAGSEWREWSLRTNPAAILSVTVLAQDVNKWLWLLRYSAESFIDAGHDVEFEGRSGFYELMDSLDHAAFNAEMPQHACWCMKRAIQSSLIFASLTDVSDAAIFTAADVAAMKRWKGRSVGGDNSHHAWCTFLGGTKVLKMWAEWATGALEGLLYHVAIRGCGLDVLVSRTTRADDPPYADVTPQDDPDALQPLRDWLTVEEPALGTTVVQLFKSARRLVILHALLPAVGPNASRFAASSGTPIVLGELWQSRELLKIVLHMCE